MILAAGLGTRLRPLSEAMPKPAVPICGIAPIRWNLAILASAGVREVVVNTHWRPKAVEEAVGDVSGLGLTVYFSHEPRVLGTGGGLVKAAHHFRDETFFLVNGKLLFDADLHAAFASHMDRRAMATMVVRPYPRRSGYGAVNVDAAGNIREFTSNPKESGTLADEPSPLTPRLFTGVHVLEPAVIDRLPEGGPACIKTDGYIRMINDGETVCAHLQEHGYWAEPSTPRKYLMAVRDLLGGKVSLEGFRAAGLVPFEDCEEVSPGVFVHRDASISDSALLKSPCWIGPGARLERRTVVGPEVALEAGTQIGEEASLTKSVVWPDTRIQAGEKLDCCIAVERERIKP